MVWDDDDDDDDSGAERDYFMLGMGQLRFAKLK